MCSYVSLPPICSPIQSSMWAQEQIFDSGTIFRLWSKYILYCFKYPNKLPDHSYAHKTSLHLFWNHFNVPFDHQYYSKFMSRGDVCEASTSLALPNDMTLFEHLHMTKWIFLAQFETRLTLHVSAPSWSSFLDQIYNCEATMIYLGPFPLKTSRIIVPP